MKLFGECMNEQIQFENGMNSFNLNVLVCGLVLSS